MRTDMFMFPSSLLLLVKPTLTTLSEVGVEKSKMNNPYACHQRMWWCTTRYSHFDRQHNMSALLTVVNSHMLVLFAFSSLLSFHNIYLQLFVVESFVNV